MKKKFFYLLKMNSVTWMNIYIYSICFRWTHVPFVCQRRLTILKIKNIILDLHKWIQFVVIDNESESLGNSIHTGKNPSKCEPLYVNCAMSETKMYIEDN